MRVDLTFEEAVFGCKKKINIDVYEECEECKGKGGKGDRGRKQGNRPFNVHRGIKSSNKFFLTDIFFSMKPYGRIFL